MNDHLKLVNISYIQMCFEGYSMSIWLFKIKRWKCYKFTLNKLKSRTFFHLLKYEWINSFVDYYLLLISAHVSKTKLCYSLSSHCGAKTKIIRLIKCDNDNNEKGCYSLGKSPLPQFFCQCAHMWQKLWF